jgi:gamma-glutamylcyclotransferase (GGCT)/AIG2-like uncharacterized protein YtfP
MSNPSCYKLFVYGSLRKGFNSPAYEYMSRYFDLVDHGKVQGKLYDLGDYPAAIPTDETSYIIGELYVIKQEQEFEWAVAQLDDYEGVDASYDEPALYKREIVSVQLQNGETTEAWVYWYCASVEGKPIVPSGDVLEYNFSRLAK